MARNVTPKAISTFGHFRRVIRYSSADAVEIASRLTITTATKPSAGASSEIASHNHSQANHGWPALVNEKMSRSGIRPFCRIHFAGPMCSRCRIPEQEADAASLAIAAQSEHNATSVTTESSVAPDLRSACSSRIRIPCSLDGQRSKRRPHRSLRPTHAVAVAAIMARKPSSLSERNLVAIGRRSILPLA